MTKAGTVTAILPNYNYARFFSSRIDGILNQTYPVSEIVILDDASSDNSKDVINQKIAEIKRQFPNLKIKTDFASHNSGNVFHQWQKGIELATSQYIWICELDDQCKKDFLETAMQGFQKNSKTIISYTGSKFISDNNRFDLKSELRDIKNFFRENRPKRAYCRSGKEELEKVLLFYNTIPNISAVVFRKSPDIDFDTILKESSKFALAGDWYFYSELLKFGNLAYNPKKLNLHRIHSSSVTSKTTLKDRYVEITKVQDHIASSLALNSRIIARLKRNQLRLAKKWGII